MIVDIPINIGANASPEELHGDFGVKLINGRVDKNGHVHRAPGFTPVDIFNYDTGSRINGLFSYRDNVLTNRASTIICSGGRAFRLYFEGAQILYAGIQAYSMEFRLTSDININSANILRFAHVNDPAKFPGYPNYIAIADGSGPIAYINTMIPSESEGAASVYTCMVNSPFAPNPCSHVVAIDGYLIGNNIGSQTFDISYPSEPFRFDGDFASAVNNIDDITAIIECQRKVIIFGNASVEIWVNDGTTPFRPDYNHINSGCAYPDSICNCDGVLYWLDNRKRIVSCDISASRTPTPVSDTLNAILQRMQINDIVCSYAEISGQRYYVINLRTENRTFAIDTTTGFWFELGLWDKLNGQYDKFDLEIFTYNDEAKCMAGSGTESRVYSVANDYYTYGDDDIRMLIRTPTLHHGTSARKFVKSLKIGIQRTWDSPASLDAAPPVLMVRWRDNGATEWCSWRTANLSPSGKSIHMVEFQRCGSYFSRQYEIVLTGGGYPIALTYVKEDHK